MVVLVKDTLPRGSWKLAIITETIKGSDDQIRSAKIRLASGNIVNRPLSHLFPLECSSTAKVEKDANTLDMSRGNDSEKLQGNIDRDTEARSSRPIRKAAEVAKEKIAELFRD